MKGLKHGLIAIGLVGAALAGVWWFGVQQDAKASAIEAPAATQDASATITVASSGGDPEDARLQGLPGRSDGARLLWSAAAGETILEAGFADTQAVVISSTTTSGYRVFAYDLATRGITQEAKSATPKVASSSRQMQRNADRFCDSEPNERNVMDIWCYDASWQHRTRLTSHDGQEDLIEPTISPDGNWVAFEVNTDRVKKGPTTPASTVWRVRLNGANLQQLTRGADDRNPTWSDDGGHLYFQRRTSDGNWDMYAMAADGSNLTPILRTLNDDERWVSRLPGDTAVIAAVGPRGAPARVKKIDLNTKAGEWLTDGTGGAETHVSVSPDGRLFSFVAPLDPSDPTRLGVWLKALSD